MAHLSVIVPVYNADECLEELYRRVVHSCQALTSDFEILLIEDSGKDRSWEVIRQLSEQDRRVKAIRFSRNFGQHYAITAGLDHSNGDWVVVMDCDLQDPPEDIGQLYAKALEGFDVVLARRVHRHDPLFKKLCSVLFYKILSYFSEIRFDHRIGNYRILSRRVVENIRSLREQLRFLGGLVHWVGFKTASVDIAHARRLKGKSSYSLSRSWKLAVHSIIAYSDKPLRMFVRIGFFISAGSFLCGLFIVLRYFLFQTPVMGWSSLMVSLYFLGGIIIAVLGVIGIYLGKTFDEAKKRPLYVIESRIGF
jgi:dolichol-phosphate mannosyltransferase